MGARLAADTMAEIPDQLLKFFSAQNIRPNPPRPAAAMHMPQPPRSPTAPAAAAAAGGGGSFDPPPAYTR